MNIQEMYELQEEILLLKKAVAEKEKQLKQLLQTFNNLAEPKKIGKFIILPTIRKFEKVVNPKEFVELNGEIAWNAVQVSITKARSLGLSTSGMTEYTESKSIKIIRKQ